MLKRAVGASAKNRLIYLRPEEIRTLEKDRSDISSLVESIRHNGLLTPLTVRRSSYGYELILGGRRYRAAVCAGLRKLPCLLVKADDLTLELIRLADGIHSRATEPISLAERAEEAMRSFKVSPHELSGRLGITREELSALTGLLKSREGSSSKSVETRQEDNGTAMAMTASPLAAKKGAVSDIRFFINSFNRIVSVMRETGYTVSCLTEECENDLRLTVRAGRKPSSAREEGQLPLSTTGH